MGLRTTNVNLGSAYSISHTGYDMNHWRPKRDRMCRYRYRNNSPKRKRWDGWQFKASHDGYKTFGAGPEMHIRPNRIRRLSEHDYSTTASWVTEQSSFTLHAKGFAETFTGYSPGRKAGAWWKQNCIVGKEIGKANGYDYRKTPKKHAAWYKQVLKERRQFERQIKGK